MTDTRQAILDMTIANACQRLAAAIESEYKRERVRPFMARKGATMYVANRPNAELENLRRLDDCTFGQ